MSINQRIGFIFKSLKKLEPKSYVALSSATKSSILCNQFLNKKIFATSSLRYTTQIDFKFDVSRFNDIHVRADHILKYNQETDSNRSKFESSLKGLQPKFKGITFC
jgi:hypothetical protein